MCGVETSDKKMRLKIKLFDSKNVSANRILYKKIMPI